MHRRYLRHSETRFLLGEQSAYSPRLCRRRKSAKGWTRPSLEHKDTELLTHSGLALIASFASDGTRLLNPSISGVCLFNTTKKFGEVKSGKDLALAVAILLKKNMFYHTIQYPVQQFPLVLARDHVWNLPNIRPPAIALQQQDISAWVKELGGHLSHIGN
jgi:hypothetical protein